MKWHTSHDFPPLRLVMNGQRKYRVIRSVRDAAEVLITEWPAQDGEAYIVAVRACLDAYNRTIPVADARAALIKAANEDGMAHFSVVR